MSQPDSDAIRRLQELSALCRELAGGERGTMGRLLAGAGDLLRRFQCGRAAVDEALGGLPAAALEGWARGVEVEALAAQLARAADEAVEAALPEAAGEGNTWAEWAWQGLCARDQLESCIVALERAAQLGVAAAAKLRERLMAELVPMDRALRPRARWLSAVNPRRRLERDALLAEHRERAWWFTARADCDELVALLAGELQDSPHLDVCPGCRRDLEVARAVETPRTRHLSADDLWRLDAGSASQPERAAAHAHAQQCGECAKALHALAEGERAIEELTGGGPPSPAARTRQAERPLPFPAAARTREREPRLIDERGGMKVFLASRRNRLVVFVEADRSVKLSTAIAFLGGRKQGLPSRASPKGLEIELGAPEDLDGLTVKLVVELETGRYETDIEL